MPDKPLAFTEHLDELRRRVLVMLVSTALFSSAAFYFAKDILRLLKVPAGSSLGTLAVFSPTAAVLCFIKIAVFSGLIFSVPVFLYELWMFILPAIDPRIAQRGFWFILSGTLLFAVGVLFGYFVLLPAALKFLLNIARSEIQYIISLDEYLSFVLILLVGTGVVFEIPILVLILAKLGVLTSTKMAQGWRIAIVVILIAAAVITPTPDVVNMILMSLPMFILYGVSIFVARFSEKKEK